MVKKFLPVALVVAVILFTRASHAGTVTGKITTSSNGGVANGTLTFTLTQAAVAPTSANVPVPASIATTGVNCWTDSQGNVVGLPGSAAVAAPSLTSGGGSLPAGTYFVRYTWVGSVGETEPSVSRSVTVSGGSSISLQPPVNVPANATGMNVYIGTVSGSERLQTATPIAIVNGALTGGYTQSGALNTTSSVVPTSNTTQCSLRFNDELVPSYTGYNVDLVNVNGMRISGFPQKWYLAGGALGTVNLGTGTPLYSGVVQYPQAVVTNPQLGMVQSINGPLNMNGFPIFNTTTTTLSGSGISLPGSTSGAVTLLAQPVASGTVTLPNGGSLVSDTSATTLSNKTISGGLGFAGATSGTTTVAATAIASGTLTLPAATDTLVGRATADTLTNKTFDTAGAGNVLRVNGTQLTATTGSGGVVLATSPTISSPSISAAALTNPAIGSAGASFTGSTSGTTAVKATGVASGTLTLPAATDTLVGRATADTLSNKTISAAGLPIAGATSGTTTMIATAVASGTLTLPAATDTLVGRATADTLSSKTIAASGLGFAGATSGTTTVAATGTASGTLTLPAATDTLVGKATTDTLTNKTFDTAGVGNVLRVNGTQLTATTGSGAVVLGTAPTISSPSISAAALTNPVIGPAGASFTGSTSGTTAVQATGVASGTLTLPAATDTLVGRATTDTLSNKTISAAGLPISGSTSGATTVVAPAVASGTLTLPAATDTLVGKATTDTLTNKTIAASGLGFTGATSGTTTVAATGTASGTLTLPAATDTLVGKATTDTLTNKTFDTAGAGNLLRVNGTQLTSTTGSGAVVLGTSPSISAAALTNPVIGSAGASFTGSTSGATTVQATGVASGTLTLPAATDTLVGRATTDTLSNKTISAAGLPVAGATSGATTIAASAVASGTVTLPAATDTLVGKATTDTLTNKTLDTAGAGNVLKIAGTQVSAVTGTGATVVLATSPTLTTPALGAASGNTLTLANQVAPTNPSAGNIVIYGDSGTGNLTCRNSSGASCLTATAAPPIVSTTLNPAATGLLRAASGDTAVAFRNAANTADVNGLSKSAGDVVQIGGTAGISTSGPVNAGTATITGGTIAHSGSTSGTTNVVAAAVASGTLTLPAATDTLIGKATTDTLTNKTYDTAGAGNVLRINGTQVNAVTGTGSVVLATSPTLTTPALGAASGNTLTFANQAAPVNPSAGNIVIYGDSGTGNLTCRNSSGASCLTATASPPLVSTTLNPATTGLLRAASGDTAVAFRNAANTADVNGLSKSAGDVVQIGGTAGISTSGPINAGTATITGGTIAHSGSTSGTTNVVAAAVASGTLTLPAATDTLVARATTDTFTNKTLDTAGTGNIFKINGTAVNAVTGSGSTAVLNTNPNLPQGAATGAALSAGNGTGLAYIDISSGISGQGGLFEGTNDAATTAGYSAWVLQNAFYNGTNWIQLRGVGTSSHALAVSHHKDFSFNFAAAGGTNNAAISWTEWANLGAGGFNLKTGTYQVNGSQIAASNLSNGVTGSGAIVLATSPTLATPIIGSAGAAFSGSTSGSTTLKAPAVASGTLTLPAATDTLVGQATTDTLSNKTYDTAGAGNVFRINANQVNAVTGTGSTVVLATSPTLTTPTIGAASGSTLTFTNQAAPANPAAGKIIVYGDSTTGNLTCRNSAGGNCILSPFVSSSLNPAASGVLQVASGDVAVAFRNAANTADVNGLSKTAGDVVQVGGAAGMSTGALSASSVSINGDTAQTSGPHFLLVSGFLPGNIAFATFGEAVMPQAVVVETIGVASMVVASCSVAPSIKVTNGGATTVTITLTGSGPDYLFTGLSTSFAAGNPLFIQTASVGTCSTPPSNLKVNVVGRMQ